MKSLLLFLLIISGLKTSAKTYYFSANGNDANNGTTTSTPWKTLKKLNSSFNSLASGDHVLFNRGDVFYGTIIPTKGFTAGNPVVFGAYGSGVNPVITGFTTVSAWTNLGSDIWESTSAVSTLYDLNLVVINGVNTAMGRFPNSGYLTYQSHSTNVSITSSSLNASVRNWTGADVVMKTFNFVITRNPIKSASGGTINYTSTARYNNLGNNGFGFFIENDVRTLDIQNEWYYNPSTKKLRIYSKSSPENVKVSTLDTLVYMIKKANFTFDGINFTGSNRRAFFLGSDANITIQNCNFDYHGLYAVWGGNNYGLKSSNFNFNHNTVNHINSQGIILQNEFTKPYIGYNTFKNCGILAGMFKVASSSDIWNQAYGAIRTENTNGLTVEYNTVDSTGYTGIHFGGSNTSIHHNEVSHHCMILMDGGGIYTWTGPHPQFKGNKIFNNIVHDGIGDNAGSTNGTKPTLVQGIYCDENTGYTEVYNNTCFNNPAFGIFSNSNSYMNFHNNTCYNNGIAQVLWSSQFRATHYEFGTYKTEYAHDDTAKHNIFFAKASTQLAAEVTTKYDDVNTFFNVLDSNYYVRPIDDNVTFFIQLNSFTSFLHYNMTQWKAYVSIKDHHSNKSPKNVTTVKDLRLEYNATRVNKTIQLDGNYIDVKNVSYNGTVTLAPYSSVVLIRNGAAINQSPTAIAGANQSIALPTNNVSLTGSGTDADGTVVSYAWTKISGPLSGTINNVNSASTTVTALVQGVYRFQLRVTDNNAAKDLDTVQITVNAAGNISPTAKAGANHSITLPTDNVSLTGSGTDVDGTVVSYAWAKISGPSSGTITSANSASTSVTTLVQGVYKFQIAVIDNARATALDTVQITVNAAVNAAGGTLLPAVTPANTVNGLDYKYYEAGSGWMVLPTFSTLTPVKTGATTNFDISFANRSVAFSFNFTGFINVPSDGQYIFYTTSDDGSNLYIDNVPVVNNDGLHPARERSGTIGLQAGKHAISVGFFQQGGGRVLNVSYSGTGVSKQAIPASRLYRISTGGSINVISMDVPVIDQSIMSSTQVGVKTYPNPFADYIEINITGGVAGKYKVVLVDASGKTVWTKSGIKNAGAFQQSINTSALVSGIYILKVIQNNTYTLIKLVK
jgi:hypothetical protein